MIDLRSETDYNMFHIAEAERMSFSELEDKVGEFHLESPNTLIVLMSNDETLATEAWKFLVAESIQNVYILDGGVNNWLATFWDEEAGIEPLGSGGDEELRFDFSAVLGSTYIAADPDPHHWEELIEYIPTIKMELKRAPTSGGCG